MIRKGKGIWLVVFLLLVSIRAGTVEGKGLYGQAAPDNATVVKLKEVSENHQAYRDKEVVIEGFYGGECAGCAGFYLKERLETIEVYPQTFKSPRLDKGKPIRVYGIVRIIGGAKKEGTPKIVIEGKGVEVK